MFTRRQPSINQLDNQRQIAAAPSLSHPVIVLLLLLLLTLMRTMGFPGDHSPVAAARHR